MIFTELKWCQISQSDFAEAIIFLVVAFHRSRCLLHVLPAGGERGRGHRSVEGRVELEKGLK